jgi:DNA-binding LacI/PurR family transcriptional regulator
MNQVGPEESAPQVAPIGSAGATGTRGRRPTIGDVARRAGVSNGAVSLVFGDRPGVGRATAERIRAAAAELGWVPNAGARSLSSMRSYAVGIVLSRPAHLLAADPFFAGFIAGVEHVLARHDYALLLRVVESAEQEEHAYRGLVGGRRVDGFILTDTRWKDPRIPLLSQLGAPTVALGPAGRSCPFPVIGPDDRRMTTELVHHLIDLGHTRIAHVSGPLAYVHSRVRRTAWRAALRQAGLKPQAEVEGDFTAASGAAATERLLRTDDPPTAIFFSNDLMALGGMSALIDNNLAVPGDVSITGYSEIDLAAYSSPGLTTVRRDLEKWGQTATRALLGVIDGGHVPDRTHVDSELVIRSSTGPAPKTTATPGTIPPGEEPPRKLATHLRHGESRPGARVARYRRGTSR